MKADPGVKISSEDFFLARVRWINFWVNQGLEIPSFSNFLGITGGFKKAKSHKSTAYSFMIRKSAATKIQKLCGEHWYALLKTYQIRKGL